FRGEISALVGTVAEWLVLGPTATAEVVLLAFLELYFCGLVGRNNRSTHLSSSLRVQDHTVTAIALRPVHALVGSVDDGLVGRAICSKLGDTETCRNPQLDFVDIELFGLD